MNFRLKNNIVSTVHFVALGGDQNLIVSSNFHQANRCCLLSLKHLEMLDYKQMAK